jgi:hypothetical protein
MRTDLAPGSLPFFCWDDRDRSPAKTKKWQKIGTTEPRTSTLHAQVPTSPMGITRNHVVWRRPHVNTPRALPHSFEAHQR